MWPRGLQAFGSVLEGAAHRRRNILGRPEALIPGGASVREALEFALALVQLDYRVVKFALTQVEKPDFSKDASPGAANSSMLAYGPPADSSQ